ncbi:cupin domain-containing protein [Alteribacillus bidgolensis]|uniref:cupin domain-containing protein n=1 Tax=Alteribacillus bidgolensis TaxID=930129 RepID=UPI000B82EBA6|nr:cupin domain-containing protein [Alteribacillus bidgolensis]
MYARKKQGTNYTAAHFGKWEDLKDYKIEEPVKARGKAFLNDILGLNGMEVSMNSFPLQTFMPFHHKLGENEELYIFVKGQGQYQVDEEIFDVEEGTVVRVAPAGVRIFRNNSDENLYFIYVQAKENSLQHNNISDGIVVEKPVEW